MSRPHPDLLSETERKQLQADAEYLWRRLEANDIGGFSGINRPFYIMHAFKEAIEKFGRRDVGLTWSHNDLEADKYGNRDGELKFCSFPDCGCDGARLCMAEEGPSRASIELNLEKGPRKE